MTAQGMFLVARLEFRTRLRTGRWKILLGVWFLVVALFSLGLRGVLSSAITEESEDGVAMFGTLLFFVLLLMLLIAPSLTAQSINGDRERGTLAQLQMTLLTPLEIASGKLLAAWSTGLAVLALALPFIAWPILEGDVDPLRGLVCLLVTALLIGVVCAVSQALSALVVRSVTSALLSYLTVFGMLFGTLITFGLATTLVTDTERRVGPDYSYTEDQVHTERIWWILAPNPFVVLSDAAPRLPRKRVCWEEEMPGPMEGRCYYTSPTAFDPLGETGQAVRAARVGPQRSGEDNDAYELRKEHAAAVWPFGLAVQFGLAAGALAITARRLRTPADRLPKGVRIA